MRKSEISPRALEVFNAIVTYKRDHDGAFPAIRRLQKMTGIASTSTVAHHLRQLHRFGYLEWKDGKMCVRGGFWIMDEDQKRL